MSLLKAVPFLKAAVAREDVGKYVFYGGLMFARSPGILASYPVPHVRGTVLDGEEQAFALSAEDVERPLTRMESEPTASPGDGTLVLRCGSRRSTVDLLPAESPEPHGEPEWEMVPNGLLVALRTALPFIDGSDGPYRAARLENGRVLAVSASAPSSVLSVDAPGLEVSAFSALPEAAIAYLTKLDTPEAWHLAPGSAVSFSWSTGARVRCQLSSMPWAEDIFDRALALAGECEAVEVTKAWREALADAVAASGGSGGSVLVTPDGIVGRSAYGEHVAEFETGAHGVSRWPVRTLAAAIAVASSWCPDAPEAKARFDGPGLRGMIVGQR